MHFAKYKLCQNAINSFMYCLEIKPYSKVLVSKQKNLYLFNENQIRNPEFRTWHLPDSYKY